MVESILRYDELQLRLEKEGPTGSYRVLAFGPDERVGRGTFAPPFTDDELNGFVRGVGLVRKRRSERTEEMEEAKSFGAELFRSLMKEQVGEVYQAAHAAAQANDRGLRITLYLSGAPELMRLPWEFLYRRPRFLSQSIRTPLVRSLDLESARPPREVKLPLRILGVVSSPAGYEELDAAAEQHKLENAVSRLRDAGVVELHWLERATLAELERRITEPDEIHVLHYIGHGAYDEATERGILVLESARGRPHDVTGEDLGAMLQDEESLRLVVLNSCEGARTSHVDPFSGAATSLLEFAIPAVIGMQFEITDEAAIAFSDRLYTALAQGLPVDAALAQARRAIVAAGKETEFATPVLFLRGADARIFDVQPPSDPRRDPAAKLALYDKAQTELGLEHYETAILLLDDLLTLDPQYPGAKKLRDAAIDAQRVAESYRLARDAERAGDWSAAINAYAMVLEVDPKYRDAAERQRQCQRIADLVAKLRLHASAKRWRVVLDIDADLTELDPTAADPDGLTTQAREKLYAEAQVAGGVAVAGALVVMASTIPSGPVHEQPGPTWYVGGVALMSALVIVLIGIGIRAKRGALVVTATGIALALLGEAFPLSWSSNGHTFPSAAVFWLGACGAAVAAFAAGFAAWLTYRQASRERDALYGSPRPRTTPAVLALLGLLIVIGSFFLRGFADRPSTWKLWTIRDPFPRYPLVISVICAVLIALAAAGLLNRRRLLVIAAATACFVLGEVIPLLKIGYHWSEGTWLAIFGAVIAVFGLALALGPERAARVSALRHAEMRRDLGES
jgi:tetratricopeptide (TPR) repeat protein